MWLIDDYLVRNYCCAVGYFQVSAKLNLSRLSTASLGKFTETLVRLRMFMFQKKNSDQVAATTKWSGNVLFSRSC